MTWVYSQSTGELRHGGNLIGIGYAGRGIGRNEPDNQHLPATGPIPRGFYTIGKAYKHAKLGPVCMNLEPDKENKMFGRSLFRIHGNNLKNDASLGCIIMGPAIRRLVAFSNDRRLEVVKDA